MQSPLPTQSAARRLGRYTGLPAALAMLLCACSAGENPDPAPADPVVVYAGYEDATYLRSLFGDYTKVSGVQVILRNGSADAMVDDLIRATIEPPADLLLTPTVSGVQHAGYEGALRPLQLPEIESGVAARLRDPDGTWLPLSFRRAAIAFNPERVADSDIASFEALAGDALRGRICLVSSSNPVSRAVIATMIEDKGVRAAEIVVRGWVDNLAYPVFEDEAALVKAVNSGDCELGLVSEGAAGKLPTVVPRPAVVDIEGIGIGRHARNPAGAAALIEWLLSDAVQKRHAAAMGANPATSGVAGTGNVSLAGHLGEAVTLLAERARYH